MYERVDKNGEVEKINKIQLLKEPGYVYDLLFVFYAKFNTQLCVESFPNPDKKEENTKNLQEILSRFHDIPDDLYVFFHAIETGRIFLTTFYFKPYRNQFAAAYNFQYLQTELSDQNKLVRNLIKFYFHDFDHDEIEQCASSLNRIFSHIKDSKYSDEEKNKLYEFFIDPSRYIQLLRYELMKKELVLSEYYKENYQKIIDLYNQTSFESLHEDLKRFCEIDIEDDSGITYASYCLLNKFCISVWFLKNGFMPLLGCEYTSVFGYTNRDGCEPDLCGLGTALCEESRIKILRFLHERNEVTCKDLEREFSFSGSTAYHHITIMTKCGLVTTRNEGKTILYSLNAKYINNVIDAFYKLLKKKEN